MIAERAAPEGDVVATALRLRDALRARGVAVGSAVGMAEVLDVIDLADRRELFLALRATLIQRVEDFGLYAELFDAYWGGTAAAPAATHGPANPAAPERRPAREDRERRRGAGPPSLADWLGRASGEEEPVGTPAFGVQEALAKKDFGNFGDAELDEITRVAKRMARRLAARPGRRWIPVRRGPRVHPRRTMRRAFQTAGEMMELSHRRRKPRKTRLVILCDVSGSMELYSRFLLQFVYALQNSFSRVETFVFSTGLSRVSDQLRGESYRSALAGLSREVRGWAGGTRIGESLATFDREWPRLVDRRTVVVVLSDGWDTGEPAVLAEALRSIRRRAGRLIWLNPLLGDADYQPLTRGMQAALPHVDLFAPAHNLASLRALVRHLVP